MRRIFAIANAHEFADDLDYEYERPGALWGANRFVYNGIYIPGRAYRSAVEKRQVEKLLARLKAYQGQPIPKDIDDAFAQLVRERRAQDPLRYYVVNPAIRLVQLWVNPFSSFGWPNEMPSSALRTAAKDRQGSPMSMRCLGPRAAASQVSRD